MGKVLREELEKRLNKDFILEVRGKGLLNAIVLNPSKSDAYPILFYYTFILLFLDFIDGDTMCLKLKENGLILKQTMGNILRLSPPLIINEMQIREGVDIIVKTFSDFA